MRHVPRSPGRMDTGRLVALLAQEGIEVTRRSIQRDLERLAARFTTLRRDDRDKPYGWYWDGSAPLVEIPGMGVPAAVTFSMTEAYLASVLPRSTLKSLDPHFARAREVLAKSATTKLASWPRKVRVVPRGHPLLPPDVPKRVLDGVYSALLDDRRFTAFYKKRGTSAAKEYEVNPLGLVVRDGVLTLVCTFWDYDDVNHMLLHRMTRADLLEKRARRPRGFDLDQHVASGGVGFALGEPIALEALVDDVRRPHPRRDAHRQGPAADARSATSRKRLRATVPDTMELRGWLLGYGALIEVKKPKALREEMRETVRAMAERYGAG